MRVILRVFRSGVLNNLLFFFWLIAANAWSANVRELEPKELFAFDFNALEMQFDSERECAYLNDSDANRVLKISLKNGAILAEVAFTNQVVYATTSPNGERLYAGFWTDDFAAKAGYVAEFNLNTFEVAAFFPVSVRPTFLVATDQRQVIVSDSGDGVVPIKAYSAVTGAELGSRELNGAWYGSTMTMSPSQTALYIVPIDARFPSSCMLVQRFHPVTGAISDPFILPFQNNYCGSWNDNLSGSWWLPGNRILLSNGHVLDVASDPVVLTFRRRLEGPPSYMAVVDSSNGALFAISRGGLSQVHQHHIETLNHGASFALPNTGAYYWAGGSSDRLFFGRVEARRTFLEVYANPAAGGATNRPPVPEFTVFPSTPSTVDFIQFDASTSQDDNTGTEHLVFRWDWNSDGTFDTGWSSSPQAIHRFNIAGTHYVTLEARDRFGAIGTGTQSVVVRLESDFGRAPTVSHPPFQLPFEFAGAAMHPEQPLLYVLDGENKRLAVINLSNGFIEREFQFDDTPLAAVVMPGAQRLFVSTQRQGGTNAFLAEFQTEPLAKLREIPLPMAVSRMVPVDHDRLVLGGNSGGALQFQMYLRATETFGNALPVPVDLVGLAVNSAGNRVYVADPRWFGRSSEVALDPDGTLSVLSTLPLTCGTGEFFMLPENDWILRSSGVVFRPDFTIVTNLGHQVFSFAQDDSRDVFVTVDGGWWPGRLHMYSSRNAEHLGSYSLARLGSLFARAGWVYSMASHAGQTIIERRLLPSTPENNLPPQVTIISPEDGTVVQEHETVDIQLDGFDLDGDIMAITVFANEMTLFSGTDGSWTPPAYGSYHLTAVATDNFGLASTSAPVRIHVNFPPTISLSSSGGDVWTLPATALLMANVHDVDGSIDRVILYSYGEILEVRTNAPFVFLIPLTTVGPHSFWAEAIDNDGAISVAETLTVHAIPLPGDHIHDAFVLGPTNHFVARVSNATATREKNEPLHAGKPGARSLWWRWASPEAGTVIVSTRGSTFDTLLAVYSGSVTASYPFSGLTPVVANDDAPGNAPTSRVKFDVVAGRPYFIAVDGYEGAHGEIAFEFDFLPWKPSVVNDIFASHVSVFGSTVDVTADTRSASREPGEPLHAGNAGGRSVWWSWHPDTYGVATISTEGSDFDSVLAVYVRNQQGPLTVSNLTLVAANDDSPLGGMASEVSFYSLPSEVYYIAVDGYNGAGGIARLLIHVQPFGQRPPDNDHFINAELLIGAQASAVGWNIDATSEDGEPQHPGAAGGRSVWWHWTAPASGAVSISTKGSDFDTLLAVYVGHDLESLELMAANDDDAANPPSSRVEFIVSAGTTYRISVDGYWGARGRVNLALQLQATEVAAPRLSVIRSHGGEYELEIGLTSTQWIMIETSSNLLDWFPYIALQALPGQHRISVPEPDLTAHFFRGRMLP
jgi:hypothetical protein